MTQNLAPLGTTMQNSESLECSVWAVEGGGWFENAAAHLVFGGNFYYFWCYYNGTIFGAVNISHSRALKRPNFLRLAQAKIGNLVWMFVYHESKINFSPDYPTLKSGFIKFSIFILLVRVKMPLQMTRSITMKPTSVDEDIETFVPHFHRIHISGEDNCGVRRIYRVIKKKNNWLSPTVQFHWLANA